MEMQILAFGIARDIMGGPTVSLTVSRNTTTVARLKAQLLQKHPRLRELPSFMIAVNDTYASGTDPIDPADVIAVIPPVSGG